MSKNERRAIVFQADCDLWECAECAERKKSKWVARAILGCQAISSDGTAVRFITITCHPSLKNFAATTAVFPHAWSLLYARMKREQPKLEYLMIMENHKNGRLHAHMLTNCQMAGRWWKDNCAYSGLGHQAKVRKVENEGSAAGYVSKYIGKSLQGVVLPNRFRRVRASQGWQELPVLHEPSENYDWLVCRSPSSLFAAVEICQKERLSMVEMRTGEIFDYGSTVDDWVATW